MKDGKIETQEEIIDLQFELDEPPQKVWRAITQPEFRQNWLPDEALAAPDATALTPGEAVSYRMRDNTPPFLESTVTFRVFPNAAGGTSLRIIHELDDVRLVKMPRAAANTNRSLMRAA